MGARGKVHQGRSLCWEAASTSETCADPVLDMFAWRVLQLLVFHSFLSRVVCPTSAGRYPQNCHMSARNCFCRLQDIEEDGICILQESHHEHVRKAASHPNNGSDDQIVVLCQETAYTIVPWPSFSSVCVKSGLRLVAMTVERTLGREVYFLAVERAEREKLCGCFPWVLIVLVMTGSVCWCS